MSLYDDPKATFKHCKQETTVAKYLDHFDVISTRISGINEEWLTSFFIAGLTDSLHCELLVAQLNFYFKVIALAKLFEEKNAHLIQQRGSNSKIS